jgi:hypothetical protein
MNGYLASAFKVGFTLGTDRYMQLFIGIPLVAY